MKYPASWHGDMWREGVPLGDGETGALVYGGIFKEIIMITHGKLWWKYTDPELPDVSGVVPEMRKLILENRPDEAERMMADALNQKGHCALLGHPLPVCDLTITRAHGVSFKKYRRLLDMEQATAAVTWQEGETTFRRDTFVSRASGVVCFRFYAEPRQVLDSTEWALALHDLETIGDWTLPGNVEVQIDGDFIQYAATKEDGTDFGAVCLLKHDGVLKPKETSVVIDGATNIEAFLKVFIQEDRKIAWNRLKEALSGCESYDAELRAHVPLHRQLFASCRVELDGDDSQLSNEELLLQAFDDQAPTELIEKLWSFGRYLLIAASREGGYPCQLYGLWMGNYRAIWPWNMYNVNLEMIYWQALSGNMPDLLHPVFCYNDMHMDNYRENAKKLYGCRGINICSVSTPESGLHKIHEPHILHWTAGAGWMAQHYYDYYLCTRDVEFLKSKAMPFMRDTAQFYEDFLLEDENGYLLSVPSNSPENKPDNIPTSSVVANATADFAILKELLANLLEGAQITGLYGDKVETWQNMLEKIPPYEKNEDGAIREWMFPGYKDQYEHRHLSHLYPVFPGCEVTPRTDPALYSAFRTAVDKRKAFGLKDQTGWSLAFMANLYARFGDGDAALECLELLCKSSVLSNFWTVCNDWRRMGVAISGDMRAAPVQLDANMGFTAAVLEMAVFSTKNEIYAFRAIPSKWKKGLIGPVLARTNTAVTVTWDATEGTAEIVFSQRCADVEFDVILPRNMRFVSEDVSELQLKIFAGEQRRLAVRIVE